MKHKSFLKFVIYQASVGPQKSVFIVKIQDFAPPVSGDELDNYDDELGTEYD